MSGYRRAGLIGILLAVWMGLTGLVFAQTGAIRGQVLAAVTQETLPGANVVLVGTLQGAATDENGRFSIEGLAPGTYVLRASLIGFDSQTKTDVVVQPSRPTLLLFELQETAVLLEGVTVEASVFERRSDAPTSVQLLDAEEIRRTPGGQNDLSRTLLSLPGVTGGVDSRNDVIVRGGGPGENAYFVDGIEIPQINHFATQGATGGALGLLNVDFIRETEFYTGGFPAAYGDALSSVLLVQNRPGSPDRIAGDFTVGATEAAITLDGPLGPRGDWLFSARRSYTQLLFKALGLPIRPDYWDFQASLEYDLDARSRLRFVGLGAIDQFDVAPDEADDFESREVLQRVLENDQWSYTNGLVWRRLVSGGAVRTALSRSMNSFRFADVGTDDVRVLQNDSQESENRLRVDGDFRLSRTLTLGAGGGALYARIETAFFERARPGTPFESDLRFENTLGLWKSFAYTQLSARLWSDRLTLTGGARADGNSFVDEPLYLAPRLSASIVLARGWTLNGATGVFYQSPEYLSLAVRDSAGTYANRGLPYIRADHYVAGLAWQARPSLRLSLEGFYKDYDHYPVSASDPRRSLANTGGDYGYVGAEPLRGIGDGRAYGLELFAQKKLVERLYGLGAYTLSWSEFSGADGVFRPSSWDVRHSVSLTAGYRMSDRWEMGVKWRFLSGRPWTPFDLERSAAEYGLSGRGVPDYDRLNQVRTPAYHRLDIRIDRRFAFQSWNAVVYLDLQNIYNRTNLFGYQYTEDPAIPDRLRPLENIGLLPSFGFSVEW